MDNDIKTAIADLDRAQAALNVQLKKVNIKLRALAAARAILANGQSDDAPIKRRRGTHDWSPRAIQQLKGAGSSGLTSATLAARFKIGVNHAAGILSKLKNNGTAVHDEKLHRYYLAGSQP